MGETKGLEGSRGGGEEGVGDEGVGEVKAERE